MKITKYPQSCLLIEKDDRRILIDPGSFMAEKFSSNDLPEIEAVFMTHRHPDHADPAFIASLLAKKDIPVYANQNTKDLLEDLVSVVVSPGETVEIAGFSVKAYDMPHCPLPDGSAGPPNNGYVLNRTFLHAGDAVHSNEELSVAAAAIAIAGPDISLRDARDFMKKLGAKKVIPIHYSIFSDEKPFPAVGLIRHFTPEVELIILGNAESTELQ